MKDKSVLLRLEELNVNPENLHSVLSQDPNYQLQLLNDKLAVYHVGTKHHVFVDFHSKKLQFRSQSHINAELVNKAILGKKKAVTAILDCTAGFGKDAYLMSLTGAKVMAYESNILMYSLLKDGITRANLKGITLHNENALDVVSSSACPIIYIDPMYPNSKKSAKHNKDMTFLQSFVGHQTQMAESLFEQSLQSSAQKVIIKRPVKAHFVLNKKPTSQITGKAVRFDIYQLS